MTKDTLILNKLQARYRKDKEMKRWFLTFVQKPSVSLRTIEWLASSYSKRHNVSYYVKHSDGTRFLFHMHSSYKSQIKAYTRNNFDPFRRKTSATIHLPSMQTSPQPGDTSLTTLSQVNFFRWVFENNVIDYALKNLEAIHQDIESRERRPSRTSSQSLQSKDRKSDGTNRTKENPRVSNKPEKKSKENAHDTKKTPKGISSPSSKKALSIPIPRGISSLTLSFR